MLIALMSLLMGALVVLVFLMTIGVNGVVKEKEKYKKLAEAYSAALDAVEGDIRQEANLRTNDPFLSTLLMDLAEVRQKFNEVK